MVVKRTPRRADRSAPPTADRPFPESDGAAKVSGLGAAIRPILIAVDLSHHASEVLREGFRLSVSQNAPALVLHVIDDRFPYPDLYSLGHPDLNFYKALRKDALAHLKRRASGTGYRGPAEFLVVWGKPSTTILAVARAREPQILVVGAHGLTEGAHSHRIGGTTERVVRDARVSVLVVASEVREARQEVPSGADARAVPAPENRRDEEASGVAAAARRA